MGSIEEKGFLEQFQETWEGGYYEGDPMDPMGASSYGLYGYVGTLHAVYLACIRPYVEKDTVALEIGPGRGAWSKTILARNCKRLYAVDAAPAEHTHFWEHVGRNERATYIVGRDFELSEIPDGSIDFFFSFGVFCHLRPEMCESYARSLGRKMKPGANGFVMYADFDKYNRCLDEYGQTSLKRYFDRQKRLVWLPVRLGYAAAWSLFRSKIDLPRVCKEGGENQCDEKGHASWYHWGVENACSALVSAGFEVVDADIGAVSRDPITHFRKQLSSVSS